MRILAKIRKKLQISHGQHLIEYSITLTLIMAGIMLMGPYVIRSWNANLKGWEDSIVDSQEDPLASAPYELPECSDTGWQDVRCGLLLERDPCTGGFGEPCWMGQMLQRMEFTPEGCNCTGFPPRDTIQCVYHDCCCSNAQLVTPIKCGDDADIPGPAELCPGSEGGALSNGMVPKDADGHCPPGYAEAWALCGEDMYSGDPNTPQVDPNSFEDVPESAVYGCVQSGSCSPGCLGSQPPQHLPEYQNMGGPDGGNIYCPGDNPPPTPTTVTYVSGNATWDAHCTAETSCEWPCANGSFADTNGESCGPCQSVGIEKIDQDAEPADHCDDADDGQPRFWFGSDCASDQWMSCCGNQ